MSGMSCYPPRGPVFVLDRLGSPGPAWLAGPDAREFEVIELPRPDAGDDDDQDEDEGADREPAPFRAISASEVRPIGDPALWLCHRTLNPHWCWISGLPDSFPEPPFLLTNSADHRLIYQGGAEFLPSDAALPYLEHFGRKGRFDLPIFGAGWFGFLRLDPPRTDGGLCWIYADRDLPVSGRHDDVCEDNIPACSINFPPDGPVRAG